MKRLATRLKAKEGWQVSLGREPIGKQHYFRACRSLCKQKTYLGIDLRKRRDRTRNQCRTCAKVLARERRA